MKKVIVVGGGLAGLSTAALLANKGFQVVILEKMAEVGGRCMMTEKDGYRLNFGAHAVYGRDRSYLGEVLSTLGMELSWAGLDPKKVRYELQDGTLTPPPINIQGIIQSRLLPQLMDKLSFIKAVTAIVTASSVTGERSLGSWLETKTWRPAVKHFLLQLASTNFFTSTPELLQADAFIQYYKRIFRSRHPVSYIQGGWGTLTGQFRTYLSQHQADIISKEAVTKLLFDGNRIIGAGTRSNDYFADAVVLCIPPGALKKLVAGTPLASLIKPYLGETPNMVMVYDVALHKRIRSDLSYIADASHRMFITDPSLYDPACVPEGGQLLQGIAYVSPHEAEQPGALSSIAAELEGLLDKYYPGWREEVAFKRVVEQATIQSVPPMAGYNRLPQHFQEVEGCYFAGDWCSGEGSASDTAFFSALKVAELSLISA